MARCRTFFALLLFAACALAQEPATAERTGQPEPPIDPLALRVLQATTDTLKNTQIFSFRAVMARESLGSNDQVLTFVRQNDVTVSRPNKLRMHVVGEQQTVDVYYNNGEVFLYSPEQNVYAGVGTSTMDLDRLVDALDEYGIVMPMSPFFRSDPYRMLIDGLETAYVIGRVEIDGKTFHHLAFTEADAEWQLWVEGGAKPLPRRAQIVYKTLPRQPRMTVDFFDWNLAPALAADFFVFNRPAEAKAVSTLSTLEEKKQ